jgi:hypothetical protein
MVGPGVDGIVHTIVRPMHIKAQRTSKLTDTTMRDLQEGRIRCTCIRHRVDA